MDEALLEPDVLLEAEPSVGRERRRIVGPDVEHDVVARPDFNRLAVRLNQPVYWIADANNNKTVEPDEVAPLLFYGGERTWTEGGRRYFHYAADAPLVTRLARDGLSLLEIANRSS